MDRTSQYLCQMLASTSFVASEATTLLPSFSLELNSLEIGDKRAFRGLRPCWHGPRCRPRSAVAGDMQKAVARTKLLGHRLPSWLPAALAPPQWVPSAQLLTKLPSRAHPSRCGGAGAVYDSALSC